MQNAIDEMNKFLTETVTAAEQNADDDGLPFETIDAFSTDPIGFGELSERMLARVELIFDQTVLYNRQSSKYLKACAMLERGIKYLGSACLTKIALEKKKKMSFPELRQLSTEKLYRMASFNFRKLDTALTENVEGKHELTDGLLDMQFRYYNLLQRLRSTEVKIYNYHFKMYYEEEDYTPVIHGNAFTKKSGVREYTKDHMDPPAFRNAPAFPLLSEAVSSQLPAVSGQRSAVSGQEVKSGQDSGSGDHESDQWSVTGGQQIAGSDAERALPEAESKGSAAISEENNSKVRVQNTELKEVSNSEPAGENKTGATGTGPAESNMSKEKQVPVDPAVLNQLSKQFTREEMVQMLLDPEFVRRRPKLAAAFYYMIYGDSQFLEPWIKNSG